MRSTKQDWWLLFALLHSTCFPFLVSLHFTRPVFSSSLLLLVYSLFFSSSSSSSSSSASVFLLLLASVSRWNNNTSNDEGNTLNSGDENERLNDFVFTRGKQSTTSVNAFYLSGFVSFFSSFVICSFRTNDSRSALRSNDHCQTTCYHRRSQWWQQVGVSLTTYELIQSGNTIERSHKHTVANTSLPFANKKQQWRVREKETKKVFDRRCVSARQRRWNDYWRTSDINGRPT